MAPDKTLTHLLRYKQWVDQSFYEVLEDPSFGDRPDLLSQAAYWLHHVHIVDDIFRCHLLGKPHGYESTVSDISPSLTELRSQSDNLNRWLVQYAEGLDDDSLAETVDFVFTDGQPGCMSRVEMLMHVVTHGLFHLNVTSEILAKAGMPVSPMLAMTYVRERDTPVAVS